MEPNILTWADLRISLALGWRDFRRAPALGLFFAGVYVLGGWVLLLAFTEAGRLWWSLPAMAGFPILGPFIACGFYDISRRLEAGEPLSWRDVMGVIFQQRNRQIPSMAAIIVVFFLFWNFLAHMIFALFLGFSTMTNVSSSFGVFLTPNGLTMLATGTVIGAVFAATLFSLTVISLPLLLDREVDFVTAMITSVGVVSTNPFVMFGWATLIALALFAAMLPGFLGLFLVLPLFGHATWHLYRRALE
ncbi:membrane protein [Gemmobacter tilapiae]|uniref:Membrane protein n=2 Tax=Neogemmobacter tilapiae TaxID=875041 RepID=A0A918WK52_9RHOB|nr:membrane protein [Gemmobacter tilapiae]